MPTDICLFSGEGREGRRWWWYLDLDLLLLPAEMECAGDKDGEDEVRELDDDEDEGDSEVLNKIILDIGVGVKSNVDKQGDATRARGKCNGVPGKPAGFGDDDGSGIRRWKSDNFAQSYRPHSKRFSFPPAAGRHNLAACLLEQFP